MDRNKRILISCGRYEKNPSANGICIRNIVSELSSKVEKIIVVSIEDKDGLIFKSGNVEVWGVGLSDFDFYRQNKANDCSKKRFSFNLKMLCQKIFSAIKYPDVSWERSKKLLELVSKLIVENDIDTYVASYRPYDSIKVGIDLKKIFTNKIRVIGYHLDLLTAPSNKSRVIRIYKNLKIKKYIKKEIQLFDSIVLPNNTKTKFKSNKFKYADFPLYKKNSLINEINTDFYSNSFINFAYIGTIDGSNRTINYMYSLIKGLRNKTVKPIKMHIWGNITDRENMKTILENSDFVYHGCLDPEYSSYVLSRADFCINLSNIVTYKMIPSKIFQLFSVKKPIINIIEHPLDFSKPYFDKNGYTLSIGSYEDFDENIGKIIEYLSTYYGSNKKEVPCSDNIYYEATPEYVTRLLLE